MSNFPTISGVAGKKFVCEILRKPSACAVDRAVCFSPMRDRAKRTRTHRPNTVEPDEEAKDMSPDTHTHTKHTKHTKHTRRHGRDQREDWIDCNHCNHCNCAPFFHFYLCLCSASRCTFWTRVGTVCCSTTMRGVTGSSSASPSSVLTWEPIEGIDFGTVRRGSVECLRRVLRVHNLLSSPLTLRIKSSDSRRIQYVPTHIYTNAFKSCICTCILIFLISR